MSADLIHEKANGERWVIKFQNYMNVCVATAYKVPKEGGFVFTAETVRFEAPTLAAALQGVTAQIDAQPVTARQPIGVGDVGVERGPDQVDAHAHAARRCPAVATSRGMAQLVEAGRSHGEGEHQQEQAGAVERLRGRSGHAIVK